MNDQISTQPIERHTFVVGTAGHVDHGKSTLVRRLTGVDPDRLQEEKAREMTIDLGFAWLELPGGLAVSVIDVPGHERFIKNMLAGVGGLDAAMLVVAADEGPMPQTVEHLAILDLLNIPAGLVVVTKADLVDDDWLELIVEETRETLIGTVLADADIVPVSASTGKGIDTLLVSLQRLLSDLPRRAVSGEARLPVDRVFSVSGFGTVVTGTLLGSTVEIGQELEILPSMLRARVRGLQSHGERVERALPGSRTAINLTGVDRDTVQRGDVLTVPGWLKPTMMMDAGLRLVTAAPQPLVQNDAVDVFVGASETPAHVTLLDSESIEPGSEGWVQIRFERPLALFEGDQFIVRQASPSLTIGGGKVTNAHPRRHRRFRDEVIRDLETRESGSTHERFAQALIDGPLELRAITEAAGLDLDEAREIALELVSAGEVEILGSDTEGALMPGRLVMRSQDLARVTGSIVALIVDFHARFPLRKGMAREEIRSRMSLAVRVFDAVIQTLVSSGKLRDHGSVLAIAGHQMTLSPPQQALAEKFLRALETSQSAPPSPVEFGIDAELLGALAEQGQLVRVSDSVVFSAEYLERVKDETLEMIGEHGEITLAQFRDHFGSSRKYAQAVLEYFDQQRLTRRVGDVRVRGSG
ncbi:MAG: selenocysteine-specific translation elongation factor [Chloroflexia bacterium]|nr:selenocysteine-specific translation elongation factor [Chloroflexia bacterium]